MFTYKLENGTELTMEQMVGINQYYEAACTAEYLLENYSQVDNEDDALTLGYEVRRQMDKYGFDEEEAIDEVMDNIDDYI